MHTERSPFRRAQRRLSRAGRLEEEIEGRRAHIQALKTLARISGPNEAARRAILRIAELERELAGLRAQQQRAEEDARALIVRLPSVRSRTMLEMRYLSGLTWEQISEALDITPRAALMRHRRALQQLSILLESGDGAGNG